MGDRSGRVGGPARLAHTVKHRKPQPTEKLATVDLEKLLEISHRAGVVVPAENDEVEIIRQPEPPAKFPDSSGVGAASREPAYLDVEEAAVPVAIDDDLAIPIDHAPPAPAAVAVAKPRRLRWLTLLVALIASAVIAMRMLGF